MENAGINEFGKVDPAFHTTLIFPPNERKTSKLIANSNPYSNIERKHKTVDSSFDQLKSIPFRNKFRLSKKADVRVSKFEPNGIPEDMLAMIHDAKEESIMNTENTGVICNGRATSSDENNYVNSSSGRFVDKDEKTHHKLNGNGINSVKYMPGCSRGRSNCSTNLNTESSCVIKDVNIIRNPNETLGIFIRKKKILLQNISDLQGSSNSTQSSNIKIHKGIFVSKLSSSCRVRQQSLLHVGDEILAVNNIPVSALDVKRVATIMCHFRPLILTIRTMQGSKKFPSNQEKKSPFMRLVVKKQPAKIGTFFSKQTGTSTSLALLPEEDAIKKPLNNVDDKASALLISRVSSQDDIKHSVYDNNFDLNANANISEALSHNNLLQSKFDESVQILLDAIANCDKSSTAKEKDLSYVEESKSDITVPKVDVSNHSDTDSWLSEVLQSVKTLAPSSQSEDLVNAACSHDYDDLESPLDNDYFALSSSSSMTEVNIDEMDSTSPNVCRSVLQHSQSLNQAHIPANTCNLKTADTVQFFPSNCLQQFNNEELPQSSTVSKHHVSDSDISQNKLPNSLHNNSGKVISNNRTYVQNVPKFPLVLHDAAPSVIGIMQPLKDKPMDHSNVTVDKKREWLQSGGQVSDELKKRIDGESNDKIGFSNNSTTFQKSSNQHVFYENSNATFFNNNTNTVVVHPSNQFHSDINGSSTDDNCSGSNTLARRKNSLKSPIEKSAKSLLSVSPFLLKSTYSKAGINSDDMTVNDDVVNAATQSNGFIFQNEDPSKELKLMEQNKPDVQKLTSPNRSRKKNWKKITKKFKIYGNSDAGINDLTCWTTDDINQSSANEGEGSPDPSTRQDLAVSNHYHHDPSMTNQRRLSRQLILDSKNKETSQISLNVSQFQKYKPLPLFGSSNSPPVDGCLVITLYGVKELKKGLCEAYCIVQVDDATTKRIGTTMETCKGATTWNQCFEMIVSQAKNLHFTVYTWDTRGGKHKASSRAVINLPILMQGSKSSFTYSNRLAVSLEPRGTLYIRLALESSPSFSGPLLFGADLQSIAERENGPSVVPTLVRSCIDEVEKRGKHIVGIYRLCGSAIVKKDLRRKLEESGGKVDLDENSYPDINVITGILKDFLRELPQPLFPPELLEVVTSAMEELPGPSSNAVIKEPFAPSQALFSSKMEVANQDSEQQSRSKALLTKINGLSASPAERATLYALMNHLKKVSLKADTNKMTCQNLAVCFGPVLLGPISTSPATRMDLDAAIGFKRHIQVLNYMMSNWPADPVKYIPANVVTRRKEKIAADRDSHRVSLTRRLSRVCVEEMESNTDELNGMKTSDLQTDPRASLASIPEDAGLFRDPNVEI